VHRRIRRRDAASLDAGSVWAFVGDGRDMAMHM